MFNGVIQTLRDTFSTANFSRESQAAKAFEVSIQSLEDKLACTEVSTIKYSGHSPAYMSFCCTIRSSAPVIQNEQVGSIAQLAYLKLKELRDQPGMSTSQIERIEQALNKIPQEAREKARIVPDDEASAPVIKQPARFSSEEIKSQHRHYQDLLNIEQTEREFFEIYKEAPHFRVDVLLVQENEHGPFHVMVDVVRTANSRLVGKPERRVFPEPFSYPQFEQNMMAIYGELSRPIMESLAAAS